MNSLRLLLVVIGLACCGLAGATTPSATAIVVGSKNFTESVLLAEMLRIEAQRQGLAVEHRRALGGTAILWQALQRRQIDVYPEYSGTLMQELLHDLPPHTDLDTLRQRLATIGIGISAPLGFEDGYALAVRADTTERAQLRTLSDLHAHPELRYGLSNEFIDRADGWPGLRAAYALAPEQLQGLDHDLAYRALQDGAVDVVDVYTTDAEIAAGNLRVLEDDRAYFPRYDAVLLYRLDSAARVPALVTSIANLAQRISADAMRRLNGAVKLQHRDESEVAAEYLGQAATTAAPSKTVALLARVWQRTLEHLSLVGISLALALAIGLPLGIFAAGRPAFSHAALAVTSMLQTVPALAMLVFLIPLLGIGAKPAIAALFFYSLLPIVRNTIAGLAGVDASLRDSARALGLPAHIRLLRIELPLAQHAILAGISTAAVINVGTATLGALIGAGGYGQPILTGVRLGNLGLILEGAIPAAVLALAVQALFQVIGRMPRTRRASRT
ncbi:MAG: transporter permease subunit [Nevskia sp.]|nr:transporter permease subunit [Nevskia sp.]